MGVGGQRHDSAAFPPGTRGGTYCTVQEAWWTQGQCGVV